MDRTQRRALFLLIGLGVAGQALRLIASQPGAAPGEAALLPVERRGSPAAHRDSAAAAARPLGPGETINVDRASVQELLRLPRVGPALAKAIVADRAARGPFGSVEGLDRVAGVGPKLLAVLAPHLQFDPAAPLAVPPPATAGTPPGGPNGPPNVNAMTAAELAALPGIGPALAGRIVAYRESHGPVADIGELEAVSGIGPALVARLRKLVAVR